jgi:hypothetical protein
VLRILEYVDIKGFQVTTLKSIKYSVLLRGVRRGV